MATIVNLTPHTLDNIDNNGNIMVVQPSGNDSKNENWLCNVFHVFKLFRGCNGFDDAYTEYHL